MICYRLRGQDRKRFRAYERARRRVFPLLPRISRGLVSSIALAARYDLDPADVEMAVKAARAYEHARL